MSKLSTAESYAELGALLEAHFDVAVTELRALDGGHTNRSFVVDAHEARYVLTVFDEADAERVALHERLLAHLTEHNFPSHRVVMPLSSQARPLWRARPLMLKHHLQGHVVKNLDAHRLEQVGVLLARLHAIPCPTEVPSGYIFGLDKLDVLVGSGADALLESGLTERVTPLLRATTALDLPRGLVHGDLAADNLLVDGARVHFLDFEEASRHAFVFDLAMAMVGLCVREGVLDPLSIRALLAGYESGRRLSSAERIALPYYCELSAWGCAAWRLWRNHFGPAHDRPLPARAMMRVAQSVENVAELRTSR